MIRILRQSGFGRHLVKISPGGLLFSDDLASSRSALQIMDNICQEYVVIPIDG